MVKVNIAKETHLEEQWGKTSVLVVSWGTPASTERRLTATQPNDRSSATGFLAPDRSSLATPPTTHKLLPQQSRLVELTFDEVKVEWQEKRDLFKFLCGTGDAADADIFVELLKSTNSQLFGQDKTTATRADVEDFFRLLSPSGVVNWEVFDESCENNTHMKRLVRKLTLQRRKRIAEMKNRGNRVLDLPIIDVEQQDLFWSWDSRAISGRRHSIEVDIRTDKRPAVELVDLSTTKPTAEPASPLPPVVLKTTPPPVSPVNVKRKKRCCCVLM